MLGQSDSAQSVHASPTKPKTKSEERYEALVGLGWNDTQIGRMNDDQKRVIVRKGEKPPQNGHESVAAAALEPVPPQTSPQVESPKEPSTEEKRQFLVASLGYPKDDVDGMDNDQAEDIYRNQRGYRFVPKSPPTAREERVWFSQWRGDHPSAVAFLVLLLGIILIWLAFTQSWLPRFWEQAATPSLFPVATASSAPTATVASTTSPTPVAAVKQNFLVQDANGNSVEGVRVWAVSGQDRTPDAISNNRGEVTLDLKPGQSYRISASKDGFDLYNSESLVTAGSAPLTISVKMAPTGTASERGRPGTDTTGFVAPNANTRDQAIEGAMFYGSRNGGIDSPSQVKSATLTTIPVSNWRTAFRDGNLIGFRNGSDRGDSAWVIVTTDGRVFYIQVKCSNLVIPPTVTRTPTPTPAPTRTPTPTSPPCCVFVPTPTPVPTSPPCCTFVPTPTPVPTKNPSNAPATFAPPTGPVTAPPTVTPLPISYELSIVGSEPCGSGCWRVRWRASNVTPTSANGWVVYGVVGYFTGERVNGSPDGSGNWVAEMRPLESGRTYQFQAYTAPPSGPSKATGIQTFIAP